MKIRLNNKEISSIALTCDTNSAMSIAVILDPHYHIREFLTWANTYAQNAIRRRKHAFMPGMWRAACRARETCIFCLWQSPEASIKPKLQNRFFQLRNAFILACLIRYYETEIKLVLGVSRHAGILGIERASLLRFLCILPVFPWAYFKIQEVAIGLLLCTIIFYKP